MTPKQRKPAGFIATTIAIIALVVFTAVSFAAIPLLALLVGMAVGCVLELFTGDYVVQAFNALGLTKVSSGDLPKVFGLLALIASIFAVALSTQNKRKDSES